MNNDDETAYYFQLLTLYISSEAGATGTVSAPGLGFTVAFTVAADGATQVNVPLTASLGTPETTAAPQEVVENKGVNVVSDNPISVYGMNSQYASSDMFLGLPDAALGTDYYLLGYQGGYGAEAAVVATQNATVLTINLPVAFNGHAAGVPYTVDLNQGQTYFIWAAGSATLDFSGAQIQSNLPVAVYGGNNLAYIPVTDNPGDVLIEEMFPTTSWGSQYLSVPLATRTGGDTFRVLACRNDTTVSINGTQVATLNQGAFWQGILSTVSNIVSSNPVLVSQYSNSSSYDGNTDADPSETQLQPVSQYCDNYVLAPGGLVDSVDGFVFSNYLNLEVPAAAVGAVTINGTAVPAASFAAIGATGYEGAAVAVSCGACVVNSPLPIGVDVYGFSSVNCYSAPGGFMLPTATPTVTPTGTASATPAAPVPPTATAAPTGTASPSPSPTPVPAPLVLTPHYPNPDPATGGDVWLPYTISAPAQVSVWVYDVSGELVRSWGSDPDAEAAGDKERDWDLRNTSGNPVASGVYLVQIRAVPASGAGPAQTAWEKCAVAR